MKIKPDKESFLLDLLLEEFKTASRTTVKKMITHAMITVNDQIIINPAQPVKPGDVVTYRKYKAPENTYDAPFPILYEDDTLLVVEKPAGLLTYGEKGTTGTSLYRIINDYLKERSKGRERIYVVHRLDREVSGILVFAKTEKIQEHFKEHWKETEKKYLALVEGKPPKTEGTVKGWLKENKAQMVYSSAESPGAKYAITHYKVTREIPAHSLLEIQIDTGRKHQIRVHLSNMGCPIVGDRKYGASEKIKRRIRLHAFYLAFRHPVSGNQLQFKTLMPKGFLTLGENDEKYK